MPGHSPYVYNGPMKLGQKALYASDPDMAILLSKQVAPGFGVLQAGTVMSENLSAAGNKGLIQPYVPDLPTDMTTKGKALLVADYGTGLTYVYVLIEDSYMFTIGDDFIAGRNNASAWELFNGGAITAIDRTTDSFRAKITFTTGFASANFTMANLAACWPEAGASGKYNTAKYILDQDIDTGRGSTALGAQSSVVISNAKLNTGCLVCADSTALSALGAIQDGTYTILK